MMGYEKGYSSRKTNEEAKIVWRNSIMRIISNLIYKSQHTESIIKTFQESLLSLEMKPEQELENVDLVGHINKEATETYTNAEPILDPPCVKSKGLNYTREKRHFEKRKPK
ncbi:unnamed protein product [Linum tenue]|uniref:Uncharacterized protein n=1 Tax=Linum tenue TaxID=586396 RepID=A0AAV0IC80_9ROSI|nr:unnamed protein product [Linum tenue]